MVGLVAFGVDFFGLIFLVEKVGLNYLTAASVSFLVGLLVNFGLSKIWVFQNSKQPNIFYEFLIFTLIGLFGLILNNLSLWVLTEFLAFHYILSKILTVIFVYLYNFIVRKWILF